MNEIFKTKFGSHLYGTATPASDVDWKSVFIPPARDILLARGQESFTRNDKSDDRSGFQRKNDAGEVDIEFHSLRKFLKLAAEGQTVALDMLFATPLVYSGRLDGTSSVIWDQAWKHRGKLASKQAKSFLGYAYRQASKYGVKGSRMAAAEMVRNFFVARVEKLGALAKTGDVLGDWEREIGGTEFTSIEEAEQHGQTIRMFQCCGRKVLFTVTVKEAASIFTKLYADYGHRAEQAKTNQGVDWKALSHAVRVGEQAIEYLTTGFMTFPRPNADHLCRIKTGEYEYLAVAEEIEGLLDSVRQAAERSPFPDKPNQAWIDDFVVEWYGRAVLDPATDQLQD